MINRSSSWIAALILIFGQPIFAQKEEVVVQSGHFGKINHLAFSPDGRLLASCSEDQTLRIWHLPTGKLMATFQNPGAIASEFSPSGKHLISISLGGGLRVWNVDNSSLVQELSLGSGTDNFARIKFTRTALYVLTNHQLFKSPPTSFEFIKLSDGVADFQVSADEQIKLLTNDFKIKRMVNSGETVEAFPLRKQKAGWYQVDNQAAYLFDNIAIRIQRNRIILFQETNGKRKTKMGDYLDDVFTQATFSSRNNLVLATNTDNKVYLIDTRKGRILRKLNGHLDDAYAVAVSPDETIFATAGNDRSIIVWDMITKKPLKTLYSKTYRVESLAYVPDKNQLAFGDELGHLKLISLADKNLEIAAGKIHKYPLTQLAYNDGNFFSVGKDNRIKRSNDQIQIQVSQKALKRFAPTYGMLNALNFYYESPLTYEGLRVSKELVSVRATYLKTKERTFDANSLKREKKSFLADGDVVALSNNTQLSTGTVSFSDKVASGGADGSIRLTAKSTSELVATIIPMGSKQSKVIITPDNYYMVDKTSLEAIAFKVGQNVFLPQQFDLKFNRPDLVLTRLGGFPPELILAYYRAYQKRLKKAGFTEEILASSGLEVPEIEITNSNIPLRTNQQELSITVTCNGGSKNLTALNVLVNGVPIYGTKGMALSAERQINKTIPIHLSQGLNKITLSVYNEAGLESLREPVEIFYEPAVQTKPTLHLVTIGVSEYANPRMNLQYAAKDGRDLAVLFSKHRGIFKNVVSHQLFDKDVTTANVLKLRDELHKSNVNDVVMIFVSGHGLLDKNLDYFFATHNVDFSSPKESGLHYDDLETLLDGIPSRNKVLMIDACHSGEIDKEEVELVAKSEAVKSSGTIRFRDFGDTEVKQKNLGLQNSYELSRQLFTDLRKGSGTTVLSAAGGVQLAQESSEWKNGAFTYCLLSGLKDMKADLNNDKKVMLSELQKYLFTEVSKITGGAQQPTSRIENLEIDWQIW
jgi:WD40 repeat protein